MTQPHVYLPDPAAAYRQRTADFGELHTRLDRRAKQNGNLNLALFFAAFVAVVIGSVRKEEAWYVLAGVLAISFVVAVIYFQRLKRQVSRAATLVAINQEGLHRLERNWSALPPPPARWPARWDSTARQAHPSIQRRRQTSIYWALPACNTCSIPLRHRSVRLRSVPGCCSLLHHQQ